MTAKRKDINMAMGRGRGRPKKNLTKEQWSSIDYMCMIHCTGEEIAGVLHVDYDTLNRNCREQKGVNISDYIKEHQNGGKMSLRRAQWKAAESGNVSMLIWLGKQWLGQTDKQEVSVSASDDDTAKEMENYFERKRAGNT